MKLADMYIHPMMRNATKVNTNVAWAKVSIMVRIENNKVDGCARDDGGWTWKKSDMHRKMLLNSHTPPKYTLV